MPAKPIGIVVQPGSTFANVRWEPVAGADMYAVKVDGTVHAPVIATSVTISNLLPAARHIVQVAAHSMGEWSSYSSPVYFTL